MRKLLLLLLMPAYVFGQEDWLVHRPTAKASLDSTADGKQLILSNGLLSRTFVLRPNLACISFKNLSNGQELIRSIKEEARLTVDGSSYSVGGLHGQKENAYLLPAWVDTMKSGANDFRYTSYKVEPLRPYLPWKPSNWASNPNQPTGIMVSFTFVPSTEVLSGMSVQVHYELYDGIPLVVKWLSISYKGAHTVKLDRVINEVLGVVEEESAVEGNEDHMARQHGLYVESDYAYNNGGAYHLSDQTSHWKPDSTYTSQVHYRYRTPCILEIYPDKAPGVVLRNGDEFKSVRTQELLLDSYDRERRGLAIRRMYRVSEPWTTENPIFMHLVSRNDDQVRTAIDQCVATGYEMVILSFGSHCHIEDTAAANIKKWKELADYAHSKGIKLGGYSLLSSRRISDSDDVIDPVTGKPDAAAFFGAAPCMGSHWGLAYLERLKYFLSHTGFDLLEHDGPYPGDVCASTTHPGHKGLDDSQWRQMELQKGLYRWCNNHGIYVNAPDWYIASGSNKMALGYREVNFSLSRAQQKILNRQNIYDALWEKTPSMGWGFVPLTEYQGGGADAVLEPLSQHLEDYRQLMAQYYGSGVQACYRGPRLYDTDTTRKVVKEMIDWYKQHRLVLNADAIHLRRADGKDWDGILHVNPGGGEKGLAMLYNPTNRDIVSEISLPLYYTGISHRAAVSVAGGPEQLYDLDRAWKIRVTLTIPASGYTWLTIRDRDDSSSLWMGFRRTDTVVAGRKCLIVEPDQSLDGKPWIWRTEFFGHEPQGDSMLLTKGYHVVYMDMQNMYGAPAAMALMDSFYNYLTAVWHLDSKPVLEGLSRGGLFAFNWASRHPDRVSSIYVDAPVCDFKSWPGGRGNGQGSPEDWEKLKKVYGFGSDKAALKYKGNPVDNLAPLAKAHVPILCVCGDADSVVPMKENIAIVRDRYQAMGGRINLIVKPGVGHHPHSLKDPTPIVNFILAARRDSVF